MANRDEGLQLLERSRGSLLSIVGADRAYRTTFSSQPESDQPLDFSTKRSQRLKLPEPNCRFTPSPETVHTPTDYHSPSLYLSGNGPHITETDEETTPPKPILTQEKTTLLCDALSRVPPLGFGMDSPNPELGTGLLSKVPLPTNGLVDSRKPYKYTRPFKAYPRDPLNVPLGYYGLPMQIPLATDAVAAQTILSNASDQAYLQFREQMMANKRNTFDNPPPAQRRINGTGPQQPNNKSYNSGSDGDSNGSPGMPTSTEQNGNLHIHHQRDGDCDSDEKMCNTVGTSSSVTEDDQLMQHLCNRKRGRSLPEELKDDAYWERRRKNNEAAKRSRDARRAKEDEIAIRAAFLEQENLKLRVELSALKNETAKLRCLLYNS